MEARELQEATWISQLCLALLTAVLARAGQPTPQEDIEIQLDAATAELGEGLVGTLVSATDEVRSKPVTRERLQRQVEDLGFTVTVRGGCVCVRDESGAPGCCVCWGVIPKVAE
jgi:hypothetical protein